MNWIKNNQPIVIAAMVCATILVYGLMQMWCADGQRYDYLRTSTDNLGNTYHVLLDKRTGVYYNRIGSICDFVNAKTTKRKVKTQQEDGHEE